MSAHYDHGPVQTYEIVWMSGHVETVLAHQVSYPQNGVFIFAGSFGTAGEQPGRSRIRMHAEVDGHWRLTLDALEEDIRTIRLVTGGEPVPAAEQAEDGPR